MADRPDGQRTPAVGDLSPDGSRMWNGQFWVLTKPEPRPSESTPPATRPVPVGRRWDRRGPGLVGVFFAAVVGVVLGHTHITGPSSADSLESALNEIAFVNLLWALFTYGSVVLILSLGRQGIDVLLLRSMVVAFILGVAFVGVTPLVIVLASRWFLAVLLAGLIWAVLLGPVFAMLALLANLLWYRSIRSLRPQLRIFNRGS